MKVLIFGASGMLGAELHKQLEAQGGEVFAFDRELDITDQVQVQNKIMQLQPEIIFNCAAYNAVDKAESEPEIAMRLNAEAAGFIAEAAEKINAITVHYSTGFVFEGSNVAGYSEDASPNPQSVYAKSKYLGEQKLQQATDRFYLIRLNLLFGKQGKTETAKQSFPTMILDFAKVAKAKDHIDFITDEISTPTYAPDLAQASIALIKEQYPFGIYHLVNEGRASWYDWAKEIFALKAIAVKINPVLAGQFPRKAQRPKCSVLINNKFPKLPSWQAATAEYLKTT